MTFDRITSDPAILGGAPCIKGTRISVAMILEWIASEAEPTQITTAYPHLTTEDITQAVHYAARFLQNEVIITAKVRE